MKDQKNLNSDQGYIIDTKIPGMWNDTYKPQVSIDECYTKKIKINNSGNITTSEAEVQERDGLNLPRQHNG